MEFLVSVLHFTVSLNSHGYMGVGLSCSSLLSSGYMSLWDTTQGFWFLSTSQFLGVWAFGLHIHIAFSIAFFSAFFSTFCRIFLENFEVHFTMYFKKHFASHFAVQFTLFGECHWYIYVVYSHMSVDSILLYNIQASKEITEQRWGCNVALDTISQLGKGTNE